MKIIFKGYKGRNQFECLTIGGQYKVRPLGGGYYSINDDEDMGMIIDIKNYDIEFTYEGGDFCGSSISDEKLSYKYLINENIVDKRCFYESLMIVIDAERLGVKVPSLKLEIKLE